MSKQSSLFSFMSRNDTTKMMASNDEKKTTKPVNNKFKFNVKPSRQIQQQPNTKTDENRSANSIEVKTNGSMNKNNISDCVIISDEDSVSPVKKVETTKEEDDLFADFKTEDLTYIRTSTLARKEAKTMEDIYAKYGPPTFDDKTSFDSFDIDKELSSLSSNASILNAKKKLDENMDLLKKSPKKTAPTSKFKFNTRSKPATSTDQNASIGSNSLNNTHSSSTINNKTSTTFTSNFGFTSASKLSPMNNIRNDAPSTISSTKIVSNSATYSSSYSSSAYSSVPTNKPITPVSSPETSLKVVENATYVCILYILTILIKALKKIYVIFITDQTVCHQQ